MIDKSNYGPWAVIAGGSEGVGESFAKLLAAAGINLVLLARRSEPLEKLASQLRSRVQVRTLSVDLTQADMLDRVRRITDDIEVGLLICNAGAATHSKPHVEEALDYSMRLLQLNVGVQTILSHHFGARMRQRGRGGIVLIGSGACVAGVPNLAVYSGAKAYTQMFGESLWAELSPLGVDVLVFILSRTNTPALAKTEFASNPSMPPADDPDEVAKLALENLKNGPVCAPPRHAQGMHYLRGLPRREAVELMSRSTKK